MAIEQGIVIKMGQNGKTTAWVKTVRSSACESCSSRNSCNAGSDGRAQHVEAINSAGAKVGDRIQLAINTASVLKAMTLLYLFPIFCMLGGGLMGDWLAPKTQMDSSVMAAILAAICFALALIIVRISGQRMGHKESYTPKIIRIIGREPLSQNDGDEKITCESHI